MSVFEQNLLASIHNVHAMNDPHEVLEGLRVIKTASLDHRLRPLVRMHGGVAAILTCIIHPRPSPNAWLLLDVLETAATTLLLLICSSKHNTQACQTKRYSSWKNGKSMPAEQTNPNNTEECWYDPNTVRVVQQVCNARTLLTMLKTYPNRERLVHSLSWVMLACCDIDKKTGLVARNDGGIALLLDILWTPLTLEDGTHAPRSPLSLQAPLLLLCLFTRWSESNVFAVSKANGFTILCKLTERSLSNGSSTSPMVSAAALTALSNCCRVEKMSAICGRASPAVQKAVEALEYVSNISRSHSTAEEIEEIEVTEAALHLLYNLACSSANVPSVVAYNGIEAVHLLLNRPSNPLALRGLCCKVCWKLLSAVRPDSTINLSKMKLFKTKNELKLKTKRTKSTSSGRRVPSKSSNHSTSTSSSVLEGGVEHPTTNSETEETKYSNNSNNQFKEEEDTRSKTAKECDCSEDEMNMMRKFPERISLYLSNNNHDNEEDDDDLHGWTRHEDNNKNTSTNNNNNNTRKKKYSNNQQYINHVQYVLRKEMDQALSKSITGIQVAHTSEFVIPHNVLPTSSGPLGQITAHTRKNKEGDYINDIGTPLRLHCDTNNDWVNVQQQCINRMMSLRRRTGSTDDSSYSTEIYNIDTSERPKKIATSSANKSKNVELPIDEIFELRRIARARDNQRLQRINSRSSSSSRAAESASKYGFKCSEEDDNQKDQINLHSTRVQHHSVLPVSHHSHTSHHSHNHTNRNNPHTNDTNDTDEMGTEHPSTWTAPIVQFESRFETGNLDRAYRMGNYEYNLLISNDVNTKCCTQWYFFSVIGMLKNQQYTFNIVNLEKPASQYNSGMLPCVYSELLAEQKGKGWFRRGENVCYYQNLFTKNKGNVLGTMGQGNGKSNAEKKMPCFTLTWTDTHACSNDRVYYSYCLPYTATDMLNKVQNMNIHDSSILSLTSLTSKEAYESKSSTPSDTPSDTPTTSDDDVPPPYRTTTAHASHSSHSSHSSHTSTPVMSSTRTMSNPGIVRRTILCYTLGTIPVPLLTITNFKSKPYEIISRKYIVLSGRVHPGESPASYMIDGVIDFLLSDTALAKELRNICVFKIVPMLNPDGVATGNHRCNLAGHDLNRQWGQPTRALSPTIYALKKLIQYQIDYKRQSGHLEYNNSNNIPSDQGIELFCDFHAHSRSFNIFTYGCESKKITIPNSDSPGSENSIIKCSGIGERIFPYLLSKLNPFFTYKECSFKIQGPKSKKANCGRVVVRKCGVLNTYTIETSFAGLDVGPQAGLHFTASDWNRLGHDFGATFYDLIYKTGIPYVQASRTIMNLTPPKEMATATTTTTTTAEKPDRSTIKSLRSKRSKKKKKKGNGRAKTAESGKRR